MESQTNFIAYYRVSTERQGSSGLGLEAQKESVMQYIKRVGGRLVEEYVEVESGRKADRPKLSAAISHCKKSGGILLIAKLDRLARRVHFISGLMETGVQFCAADMPNADRFMLHVYAAMAEEEARRISERTKLALQAAKSRGVKLGSACRELAERNKDQADRHATVFGPQIAILKREGLSVRKIATRLNSDNVEAYSGGNWYPSTVQRVWSRYRTLTTGKIPNPPCH